MRGVTAPGISIPITADGSGFDDELRRVVVDAMRDMQRQLDIDPLTVSVRAAFDGSSLATDLQSELRAIQRTDPHISVRGEFDSAGLISEIETAVAGAGRTIKFDTDIQVDAADLAALRELQSMPDKTIRVDVALGMSEADAKRLRSIASTLRQMQALTDVSVRVRVNLDMSPAELERLKQIGPVVRSLRTLTDKDVRVRVKLDMSPAELERLTQIAPALRSLRGLSDKDVKIKIDIQVDEAQLQRIAALLRELRSGNANFRFNSNADTEASRVDRLRDSLRSVGIGAGGMAAVAAAIAGIGGAAGLAAGAVGGLVVAAAALGPGIAAAVGTATVALAGVKDAFDAAAAAAEAGPGEAAAAAKATAAAQQQLQSAADAAADAQRNLTDAQADAEEATRAIGDAYQAAADELEDWQFKLRGSVLDQKEAALALKDAQRDVFDAKTPQERERALLRVERAQLNYDKAVADGRDVAEQAADAERKGLDNSDKVVAARKAAADAEDRVTQARRAAEQAERQVAAAAAALTEAQTAGTASSQKLAEAMAKLAPNAQDFVLAARELAPAWEEVRKSVQDTAFQGAGEGLRQLADTVLPTLRDGMTAVAAEMNAGAHGFAAFLKSTEGIEGLQAAFAIAANGLRGLREGSDGFLAGLSAMAEASAPFAEQIGRAFGSIGTALGDAFSFVAESGLLGDVLDGLTVALQGLGPLLGDLFVSLARIAADVMPTLGPLLESLGQALVTMAPALGQVGAVFAQSLTLIMPILGDFIADLTAGLAPVLPVIASLLGVLLDALQPLIEPLAQVAVVVGSALAQAIQALAPAIGPLGEAFAALVTAVAPLIPLFAESLSAVLQALAPALTEVATALAPVIAAFADQMRPVIAQVAPILAEVAMTIGRALADAIRQIAPVLPQIVTAFTNLLMAILPLLPELVRLAAELLPPLLDILVELSPVLVKLIEAFTWLVQNVLIPIVMPVIRQLADEFKTAMERIGDVIRWVKDELFPSLGNAIDTVKGWFEKGVDGITGAWDRLKESAAKPVRYVVNTVWNEGLLKAWNAVRQFLPGVEPMEPVTLGFRRGGGVFGPGTGTSDSIPAWLSAGEHVVTAAEVLKAGGQNVLYAIRDMIARGIPFTWDGGRVISLLGRENLAAYGAAVRERGIGNVSPEGLFDALLPKFRDGGAVMPWMHQLARGHDFARSQHGKPYQWAGPRWVGDSFDCSGFMGSIIAAILGLNPWTRYWATSTFAGYPARGAQGLVKGLREGVGMLVGITDDPGGPGGGHTAGELRGIPELGYPTARVESDGSRGVHYGFGTPVTSFASLYGLPIGANGFFQPSTGGDTVGPSTDEQRGFVARMVAETVKRFTNPIRETMTSVIGPPPPRWKEIPPEFLTTAEDKTVEYLSGLVTNLGDTLPAAWAKARDLAGSVLDALNPFDSGGIATGTGFMPKNVIAPERVLSPEQTRLFETLVLSLQQLAGHRVVDSAPEPLTAAVFQQGIDHLARVLGVAQEPVTPELTAAMESSRAAVDETGRVLGTVRDLADRTESSQDRVLAEQFEQMQAVLGDIGQRLTSGVLMPIMESAVTSGVRFIEQWLGAAADQITASTDQTTQAVENLDTGGDATAPAPFGAPGSAFDAVTAISDAVVSVAQTAQQAFQQVAQDVANAALAQQASRVDNSRGVLGRDISGGPLVDMLVRLTGVEIEIRDTLVDTWEEIRSFRGDLVKAFDTSGRIVADTADLMQRNESSRELVISEQNRLNRELIKALLRYLMTSVVIPILSAILGVMIQLAVTAIGAAIGSIIPGIGTAIGAAIGAVVGAALAGAAAVFTSALAIGAGAAIDAFDSGGVALGKGVMVKDTIAPERVLSPRQTEAFDRLVAALEKGGNRTVNAPMTVYEGAGAGARIQNDLMSLL
ncbi:Phage-related protein [Nocardia farcinica]|uniref:Phage-related protein n=1 Tax=Nocardia farcinica TaxID=37329 RepID=A0A0H5NU72_NOCFR|nr:hypothetical protein DXT66_27185 [Nocardia farcinica]PFX04066.1 hypothetical protein CJ469_01940 [Nocardia farcinica]PFX10224.1 hypothetical protein CJ468_01071 [Nocardia farcinica]CRY73566.1 Phage-related protein [Nocardia farcinica]SIT29617.1 Phage-related protein [Nocardia farcinica]